MGDTPPTARRAALLTLMAWIEDPQRRVADELDRHAAALDDPRERALSREIALGAVRRQRLLDHLLSALVDRGLPASPLLLAALRIGAFQLLFLDRVPPHAAVAETLAALPTRRRGFVNAVLRRLAAAIEQVPEAAPEETGDDPQLLPIAGGRALRSPAPLPAAAVDPVARAALLAGIPADLARRWEQRLGVDRTVSLCASSVVRPGVHLRPSRGTGVDALLAELRDAGVDVAVDPDCPELIAWSAHGASPLATPAFEAGRFVVQDPTAYRAVRALDVKPGERVLDLCAAPGTKATFLAEAVGTEGRVFAYDVDAERLARVRENAERLALDNLQIVESLDGVADCDAVLVDVPCSNTGVLSRRVEVRHRVDPDRLGPLLRLQRELLDRAFEHLRVGGRVVYSTCSIEQEENQDAVAAVLAARGDAIERLDDELVLPDPPRHDGGYRALLRRRR